MNFDLQPTLTGTLLELRPLRTDDFEALYCVASDSLIWEQHPEADRHKRDVFQRYLDTAMQSGGAFAIIERSSGQIIGSSRYYNLLPDDGEVEIGWTFLARQFWGGTYNRELKKLMVEHALRFVDRVVFIAGESNLRSRRALTKIGATLWKNVERPDRNGTLRPNVVYAITRESYRASPL